MVSLAFLNRCPKCGEFFSTGRGYRWHVEAQGDTYCLGKLGADDLVRLGLRKRADGVWVTKYRPRWLDKPGEDDGRVK